MFRPTLRRVALVLVLQALWMPLAGPGLALGQAVELPDPHDPDTPYSLLVVGLVPSGPAGAGFTLELYYSNRDKARGIRLEPGLPAGWSTNLSLRCQVGVDGRLYLYEPTGMSRPFARDAQRLGEYTAAIGRIVELPDGRRTLVDVTGRQWDFDTAGRVIQRTEPDGTAIVVERDPNSGAITTIQFNRSGENASPPGADSSTGAGGRVLISMPDLCTWRPRDTLNTLLAPDATGQTDPFPIVRSLQLDYTSDGLWDRIADDAGRRWQFTYRDGKLLEITGDGLLRSAEVPPGLVHMWYPEWDGYGGAHVRNLLSWRYIERQPDEEELNLETIKPLNRAGPAGLSTDGNGPPRPVRNPWLQIPKGFRKCGGDTLYQQQVCVGEEPDYRHWSTHSLLDGPTKYRGTLCGQSRWRYVRELHCVPGSSAERNITYTITDQLKLGGGFGSKDIWNISGEVSSTIQYEVSDRTTLSCCRFTENGEVYQSCVLRMFQQYWDLTLNYQKLEGIIGRPGGPVVQLWGDLQSAAGVWYTETLGKLKFCDKCCLIAGIGNP